MKRIYIVDDDFEILYTLHRWLLHKQFDVQTFSSAKHLFVAMNNQVPDVVLLDINLLGEDGRQVCKQIKNDYPKQDVSIILFSSLYNSVKENQLGCADGFINKHRSLSEISSLINHHLSKKKAVS